MSTSTSQVRCFVWQRIFEVMHHNGAVEIVLGEWPYVTSTICTASIEVKMRFGWYILQQKPQLGGYRR